MSHFVIHLNKNDDPSIFIERAAEVIKEGLLLGYPTDTVYGMGVDPLNPFAVKGVFQLKGRDETQGLPVLVADLEVAQKVGNFSKYEIALSEKFWPGQLTIIVPLKDHNDENWKIVTGGKDTIALRVPSNPITLAICKKLKEMGEFGGIIGTSANFSGQPSISDGKVVIEQFGTILNFIINTGKCKGTIPSTIVKINSNFIEKTNELEEGIQILREGRISKAQILEVLSNL